MANYEERPKISGVVFDMDGLMFDTERMFLHVWEESGKAWGIDGILEIGYQLLGVNATDTQELIHRLLPPEVDADAFYAFYKKNHAAYRETHPVVVKPGLYELLHYLRRNGYKTAVASSTSRPIVMDNLCQAQVTDFFDFIICGDMVKHSKPNPEIYAIACRELGLPPTFCLALEDSPNGIRAARGAGMHPVLIPDMIAPSEEIISLSLACLKDLNRVIPLLERVR